NDDKELPVNDELKMEGDRHENNLDFNITYSEPIFGGSLISSMENKNYISGNRSEIMSEQSHYSGILEGDFRYNYRMNRISSVYRRTIKGFTTEFGTALSMERSSLEDMGESSTMRNNFVFLQ